MRKAAELVGDLAEHVDVVASVGLGIRNASMGYWRGRGIAFLWLEHYLPPGAGSPFLDLGVDSIPVWLAHEIGHAVRYAAPGTSSSVPAGCGSTDPWAFWQTLEKLPLAERLLDEGLATAFAGAVVPEADESALLHMSPEQLRWLEENGEDLLADRLTRWDLQRPAPSKEWIAEALWHCPARCTGPWTLDRPPSRWGYCVGRRFFVRKEGDWPSKLAQ
jgi:hypothetical protein